VQTGKNPEDMVVIYGSYGVVKDHGRAVGSGFEGQGEKSAAHPTDASKDDITVYDKTTSISGGVSQTQTTFEPPKSGEKLFGVTHAPSTWRAVQHFPTQGTNGISV
jgi:hypothetical protein